jgi:hypothetical protein
MILQPIASLSVCMLLYTSELQEIARKKRVGGLGEFLVKKSW